MKAEQVDFISSYLPLARKAGESFRINPIVILAQAVIESGWGQSDLAREHHNFSVSPPTARKTSGGKAKVSNWASTPSVSVSTTLRRIPSWTTPA